MLKRTVINRSLVNSLFGLKVFAEIPVIIYYIASTYTGLRHYQ